MNIQRMTIPFSSDSQHPIAYAISCVEQFDALDEGFIAGGFARKVAHAFLLERGDASEMAWMRYFRAPSHIRKKMSEADLKSQLPGDIDVFFPKNTSWLADDIRKSHKYNPLHRSPGGFAKESYVHGDEFEHPSIQVQFVNHPEFRYGSVEEAFNSFDLVNSRYAIEKNGKGGYDVLWDVEALKADEERIIKIEHADAPFLGTRIHKYLKFRGCHAGLHRDSVPKLKSWLLRNATGNWGEIFKRNHLHGLEQQTKELRNLGLLEKEDLILFLNRWTHFIPAESGKYGDHVSVDWAQHEISKCEES